MAEPGPGREHDLSKELKKSHHTNIFFHWIAIILGVLGIALGVDAFFLQRKIGSTVTTIDGNEQRVQSTVGAIENSVSTRFLGRWPDHLPEVTNLIGGAALEHDKILILSDFVDPWSYTLPDDFYNKYYLPMLDPSFKADILVFDRATAIDRVTQQFTAGHFEPDRGYFEDKQSKRDFSKYDHYVDFYTAKNILAVNERPRTYLEFMTLLFRMQDKFCEGLSSAGRQIRIRTLANETPGESVLDRYAYFYWINKQGMVLSFRRYGYLAGSDYSSETERPINIGSAFLTRNVAIVNEFASQFDARWRDSETYGKKVTGGYCFSSEVRPAEIDAIIRSRARRGGSSGR